MDNVDPIAAAEARWNAEASVNMAALTNEELRYLVHGGGSPERGPYAPQEVRRAAKAELDQRQSCDDRVNNDD